MSAPMFSVPGNVLPITMNQFNKMLAVNQSSARAILHQQLRTKLRDEPMAISSIVKDCLKEIEGRQKAKKRRH